ncbi:cytochrome P450 2U1-like [Physella acuta]|uniref:cytochrome P450 2U1-like n=1 Tax=Physella acuta TaxID=109671 RepID=UPI0027DE7F6C|nr:cytochrome P450 2U1-like [Physella acuta]XP_059161777.1 cytochrome P450 2U1-like [Physella acuta]
MSVAMEISSYTPVLLSAVCLLAGYIWLRRPKPHAPPCPRRPLPLLGNMFHIPANPRAVFKQWRQEHGDIFCLYIGPTTMIILNGYDVIKETLIKRANQFSNRPDFYVDQVVGVPNMGVMAASGPNWKEQRSVSLAILRNFGMGKNVMAEKILEEIKSYLALLDSYDGEPTDIRIPTNMSVANFICSMMVGERYDYDDPTFQKLISLMNYTISKVQGSSILNLIPALQYLPGDLFAAHKVKDAVLEMHRIFDKRFHELKDNLKTDDSASFIASYLNEKEKRQNAGLKTYLDDANLIKIVVEIFGAGFETSSSTILWCVLFILHNPHVQEKIHQELDAVVGRERTPNMQDKPNLKYLTAVVMETQRLASVAPLGAPHTCSEETLLRGFNIPKDAYILPNLDSVLHDPAVWGDDVDQFRPERFLDSDGHVTKPEHFIPFSAGRRLCLGEGVANMFLFLYLSSMFHRYTFAPPDPSHPPPLDDIFGIVAAPKNFKVSITKRKG